MVNKLIGQELVIITQLDKQEDKLSKPHDQFFKKSFEDLNLVRNFISNYLPEKLVNLVDLDSLEPEKGDFTSNALKESFTDMLFKVKLDRQDAYLCFLFEHKSTVYPNISLQLLKYMLSIWEKAANDTTGKLPVVIPLLVYHGRYPWNVGLKLSDLFLHVPDSVQEYLPDYKYVLFDLSKFSEKDIKGSIKSRLFLEVLRNILKDGFSSQITRILELISKLGKQEGAVDYIETVFLYMLDASDDLTVDKLVKADREYRFGKEDLIMTAGEQLREEGRQEVRQEGMKLREKGRQEGMKEKAIRTARKMLMKGMKVDDVVELTELPEDEVLKLTVKI